MKRKIYYHVCFLKYESKKGLNGILINKIHTFQRRKISDNFCIHHALNDYDHDVLAQLIDVFDNPQKASEFRKYLKTITPDEILLHRKSIIDFLEEEKTNYQIHIQPKEYIKYIFRQKND